MIRFNLSTILLLLVAFLVQQFVPAFTGLSHARILVVHVVFLCVAVSVPTPTMLLLAFIGGLLWDAHCSLAPAIESSDIYKNPVEALRFGYSILLFAGMGFLMQSFVPLFRQGKWHLSALTTGVAVFLYLSIEFLIISFVRGDIVISRSVLRLLGYTSLLSMMFSPVVFAILYGMARFFDHSLYPESNKLRNS